ncbi:MAG: hypothetical protein WA667_18390 [Candidatus Nitrosopolaris sp.]
MSHFEFPDVDDPLFEERHKFTKIIQRMIQDQWNWDLEMKRLKDSRIDHINSNTMKILAIMEKERQILVLHTKLVLVVSTVLPLVSLQMCFTAAPTDAIGYQIATSHPSKCHILVS